MAAGYRGAGASRPAAGVQSPAARAGGRGRRSWEDPSGGFAHGGWIRPYADAVQSAVIRRQMNLPFDLLLGRRTFEIWAPYWPEHPDVWPGVQTATKYVASNTLTSHAWGPSVFLGGDVATPAAFRVTECQVTSTGVVLVTYERAGAIPTDRG